MKIGILGGTFDPIHNGHIAIALAAKKQCELDETWLMPAKLPPHKLNKDISEDEHRIAMLSEVVKEFPELKLSLFEYERDSVSYTYETLQRLRRLRPDVEWYYIMGEDSLENFTTWYLPRQIASMATLVVAPRDDDANSLRELAELRSAQYNATIIPLSIPWKPISSSEIRANVESGESIADMVPASVVCYIDEHNLYR